MKTFLEYLTEQSDEDHRGSHRPPMRGSGAPLHDLTNSGVYPQDVYGPDAARHYGASFETDGDAGHDSRLFGKIHSFRNKPDEMVNIFRTIPTSAMVDGKPPSFKDGDWVTIHRPYAVEHGMSALNGDYKMMRTRVKARHLYTNGDSPYEYGLDRSEESSK